MEAEQTIAHLALGAAYVSFGFFSVVLAIIDARTHRLPNRIVGSGYATAAVTYAAVVLGGGDANAAGRAFGAGAVLFGALLLVRVISPAAIGGGDVKLAGLIGIHLGWLGWDTVVAGVALAFAGAGIYAVALLLAHRVARTIRIAFGPWFLAGAWMAILISATSAAIG